MLRISGFSIESLNGLYQYPNCRVKGSFDDLLILYGDNGSGKTTILNLIFHLLSCHTQKGHLNAIARVQFKSLRVELSDGTAISAVRPFDANSFPITFSIKRPNAGAVEYRFVPESMRDRLYQELIEREFRRQKGKTKIREYFSKSLAPILHSDEEAHAAYLQALKELGITCYFMGTDRQMRSDSIEAQVTDGSRPRGNERDGDIISRVRTQYLTDALNSAAKYVNRQVIRASNTGSKNTNGIYADIIARLAGEDLDAEREDLEVRMAVALEKLAALEKENQRFSDLGITPSLDFDSITRSIRGARDPNKTVLDKILWPYIDSMEARLTALRPVGDLIEVFLRILNHLFRHKTITFSPANGFNVLGPKSQTALEAHQLSSGEQQLLLMFCYLLVSNEQPSLFLIDEPEISLNVKWQRELIDDMREITRNSKTQILIATHSIELLTQYDDMVIDLDPSIASDEVVSSDDSQKEN